VTFLLAVSRGIDAVTRLLGRVAWWMSLAWCCSARRT
jgi:TRAP-type mannitol/chloroaromatic compound transport system permease small subunit